MVSLNRDKLKTVRQRLSVNQAEQQRLLATLEYYAWLREWGVNWQDVKGVSSRPVRPSAMSRQDFKNHARRIGRLEEAQQVMRQREFELANFVMKDGSTAMLPWPPFDDNVIFNQPVV